jgi:hypothetical protein
LEYLAPEGQPVSVWIEREAHMSEAKATGANVISLRA